MDHQIWTTIFVILFQRMDSDKIFLQWWTPTMDSMPNFMTFRLVAVGILRKAAFQGGDDLMTSSLVDSDKNHFKGEGVFL